ncbi:RNA dependent RNA polymerase-domain-containing protein [Cristinia sonorae]|uniref:RNA-dependent RNA polymerase n=1 Tax=Cristinia sonorae TaxID=1940300 RepID=A0A8K0XQI8_9AGAR|nr:RNA dependent RNA polymerase-domain-containing protein [Cristinia sonorae]
MPGSSFVNLERTLSQSSTSSYNDTEFAEAYLEADLGGENTSQESNGQNELDAPIREIDFDPATALPASSTSLSSHSTRSTASVLGKRHPDDSERPPVEVVQRIPPGPSVQPPGRKAPFIDPVVHVLSDVCHNLRNGLLFGIRWELARRKKGRLGMEELKPLRQCKEYPAQAKVFHDLIGASLDFSGSESAVKNPWDELDLERKLQSPEGFLGCNEDLTTSRDPAWYGGKVHFSCRLVSETDRSYKLVLEPPVLGPSSRFTRRFGSERFIRVRIQKKLFYGDSEALIQYFQKPFVFDHQVYRAFFAKDLTVFLVETAEKWTGEAVVPDQTRGPLILSFMDFINWHNPLHCNRTQSMAKWTSRFALGLSSSVPGIRVDQMDCLAETDIENRESVSKDSKTPSHLVMTDGCGFASQSLLVKLHHKFRWESFPTAIQMRFAGAKGLLLCHPNFVGMAPTIWLRPSQVKIQHEATRGSDLALHTVDLLRSSRMSSPARISSEILINLAENGVSIETLLDLLTIGLKDRVMKLLDWDDSPESMVILYANVVKEGNVLSARIARENPSPARALGYRFEDDKDGENEEEEVDGEDDVSEKSTAWCGDEISGQPSSLEETNLQLLDSGFTPLTSFILQLKMTEVAKKALRHGETNFKIDVGHSCTAFVVPDPSGILKPGEVHIKSSSRSLLDTTGTPTDIVIGDVLLTRHPCKIATDVQKAKAVCVPQLHQYVDVIVVSTQGHMVNGRKLPQHLASMTGGGDYDGDLMFAFWSPKLVQEFREPDPSISIKPPEVDFCLIKPKETVAEYLTRTESLEESKKIQELQSQLLTGLKNPAVVGKLSIMWEASIYVNGYNHPETVKIAHLFCEVLDGAKTGIVIDPAELSRLQKMYPQSPEWKTTKHKGQPSTSGFNNRPPLVRPAHLPTFIMDELQRGLREAAEPLYKMIDEKLSGASTHPDPDLVAPFHRAQERCAELHRITGNAIFIEALKTMDEHVRDIHKFFRDEERNIRDKTKTGNVSDAPIETRQDMLRSVSRKFVEFTVPHIQEVVFSPEEWRRVMASCVYAIYWKKPRFPFNVAFRELCAIKAEAVSGGGAKTITPLFYNGLTLHKKYVNLLSTNLQARRSGLEGSGAD